MTQWCGFQNEHSKQIPSHQTSSEKILFTVSSRVVEREVLFAYIPSGPLKQLYY